MKLTAETIAILKNYATINQYIQFKEGNELRTISPQKNILTKAEISETIPKTFAIYDLNRLLGALSRLNDPDLSIGTDQLTAGNLKYTFAEAAMLVLPPEKKLDFPSPEIEFEMSKDDFESCVGMAQVLSLPELIVEGDGTETRSFCYIDDAITATKIVHKDNTFDNRIFNIGNSEEVSISTLIEYLANISGRDITPEFQEKVNFGTKRRVPDISKAKSLGYEPKISLREGFEITYKWYNEHYSNQKNLL